MKKLFSQRRYKVGFSSPLMRRIFMVNALPLVVLVATLLYLNQFQNSLVETEVLALREQARIYAGALGQSAVEKKGNSKLSIQDVKLDNKNSSFLSIGLVRPLLYSLTEPSPNVHARVFAPNGKLIVDSQIEFYKLKKQIDKVNDKFARNKGRENQNHSNSYDTVLEQVSNHLLNLIPYTGEKKIKNIPVNFDSEAMLSSKVRMLLSRDGYKQEIPPYIRRTVDRQLLITVSEPIVHNDQMVGVLELTRKAKNIDKALFSVRASILNLFLLALIITVFLSWYLSLTIGRPLLRLATSVHKMQDYVGRKGVVPDDLLSRKDEIGDVARALHDSAKALWARMDAIERFAADVSHELKNPLSSIRSAVELLPKITDEEHQQRLLFILTDDVNRLDRLITDIASSSRIEAEISRAVPKTVSVVPIFHLLSEMHLTTHKEGEPYLLVDVDDQLKDSLKVIVVEDRLVQVLRNLIGNAFSFSPHSGKIILSASLRQNYVELTVCDEGPGIPESKLDSIFERFYSERPQGENFGKHSGLGLSICRQIVIAFKGTISAHNRYDNAGKVIGACFVVSLPRAVVKV